MRHFFVVTNPTKDKDLQCTFRIVEKLRSLGCVCAYADGDENSYISIPNETECIIALGGDGTLLKTARNASHAHIPLIGINLGTLGYLAEIEWKDVDEALEALAEGRCTFEKRMMIAGRVNKDSYHDAINEIAITRKGSLKSVVLEVYVNGQYLTTWTGDGAMIVTPTGSTGYNLSAGGPLVSPAAELLLLTPVCTHTLHARPIVFSPTDKIEIRIPAGHNGTQELEVSFDGAKRLTVTNGDVLEVEKSAESMELVKLSTESFLQVLRRKMRD